MFPQLITQKWSASRIPNHTTIVFQVETHTLNYVPSEMIFAFWREIGKMSKKVQEFFKPKITRSENQKSVGSVDSNRKKYWVKLFLSIKSAYKLLFLDHF